MGTPPSEAPEPSNNQPHIVLFCDESEEVKQYFVAVEQQLMMESVSLVSSVFLLLAAHYIFNLSYHPKSGDVWVFIQENVCQLPSKGSKRSPSYVTHSKRIAQLFECSVAAEADYEQSQI